MKKFILSAAVLMISSGIAFSQTSKQAPAKAPAKSEVKKEETKKAPVNQAVTPAVKKEAAAPNTRTPQIRQVQKEQASPANSDTKTKKDGTPDRRYKENKSLKKDGTPDKRYKENKSATPAPAKSAK
ncbi:MAG: hypothetical protein WED33_12415 [Bacteroidia bacterium]